jgi:hypothetical protein
MKRQRSRLGLAGAVIALVTASAVGLPRAEASTVTVPRDVHGTTIPAVVAGDFSGDGRTDLALTGGAGWRIAPMATSNADGSFTPHAGFVGDFGGWAQVPGVRVVDGDFNGDHKTDIALVPGPNTPWWSTLPVAFSNGDGTFRVTNQAVVNSLYNFTRDLAPNAQVVSGDFNGDGRTDIALTGAAGWNTVPVALSNGDGSFTEVASILPVPDFGGWASVAGVRVNTGDFNHDGRTDIALVPGPNTPWWYTLPIAFSNGDGTFRVTNQVVANSLYNFTRDLAPTARVVSGDFNGDGRTDLALTGVAGWNTVPVALSNGDGSFTEVVSVLPVPDFGGWASVAGVRVNAGDFNNDGRTDIALVPGPNTPWWSTLPVALSNGNGTFTITNTPLSDFAAWAQVPGVTVSTGDFNGDGRTDLALVPGLFTPWWFTLPIAFSNGDGTFRVTNAAAPAFVGWAQPPPPTEAPLCNCSGPTAALTTLGNAIKVRSKSVTAIVTVPAGLPVTNSTDVVPIPPSGDRLAQTYNRTAGNKFTIQFPEGDGRRRTETIQFELIEHTAGGPVFLRFSVPVTIEALYNVTVGPLGFYLINDCDFTLGVFPEDSEVEISIGDDRTNLPRIHFDDVRAFDTRTIPQLARQLTEVSAASGIKIPDIQFMETDPPIPTDWGFSSWPAGPLLPMLPGVSRHVHIENHSTYLFPDEACNAAFDYDITINLLRYDSL